MSSIFKSRDRCSNSDTRCWRLLLCLLMCALSITHTGLAIAHARADGQIIRFNVSPKGYPPYLIVRSDGRVSGIMWDVLNHIARDHGYQVKPLEVPRKRVDQFILKGYLDATLRAPLWTAHPERFIYTVPIVQAEEVFFSLKSAPFHYNSPASLDGKTIITHLGYRYPELSPLFESGEVKRLDVETDFSMFRHVIQGPQFRILVAERHVGEWIIRKHHWQGRFIYDSTHPLSRLGLPLMFAPRWSDFVQLFNQDLKRMRHNGQLKAILAQYR